MLKVYANTYLIQPMYPQLGQYCLLPKQNLVHDRARKPQLPNHKLIKQKLTLQYVTHLLGKRSSFSPQGTIMKTLESTVQTRNDRNCSSLIAITPIKTLCKEWILKKMTKENFTEYRMLTDIAHWTLVEPFPTTHSIIELGNVL